MSDLNNTLPENETAVTEASVQTAASVEEAAPMEYLSADSLPVKGYRNRTAKLLNRVFIVSLILMVAYLLFQAGFSIFSYLQQGAPLGISTLYTLVGLSMPITLCALPFLFKFFAEVVELLDKNR